MDDESLLLSLGVVRPSARAAANAFKDVFPDAAPRPGERNRIFGERATIGLMLGQALNRNAPCKDAVRRMQIEFGEKASSSTAAYCKARGRVRPETVRVMSTRLSEEADKSFLFVVQSAYRAGRSCARAFSRLVRAVASDVLPRRRRKTYVRAVKRRPKPYPLRMKPRGEYTPGEVL